MTDRIVSITHTIIVERAADGYRVRVSPDVEDGRYGLSCPTRWGARSFARGLAMGKGWPIEDRTVRSISVEQLNESQWHAVMPDGRATGVTNWVDTLSYALVCSFAYGYAVESTDLRGARLLLVREEARHG